MSVSSPSSAGPNQDEPARVDNAVLVRHRDEHPAPLIEPRQRRDECARRPADSRIGERRVRLPGGEDDERRATPLVREQRRRRPAALLLRERPPVVATVEAPNRLCACVPPQLVEQRIPERARRPEHLLGAPQVRPVGPVGKAAIRHRRRSLPRRRYAGRRGRKHGPPAARPSPAYPSRGRSPARGRRRLPPQWPAPRSHLPPPRSSIHHRWAIRPSRSPGSLLPTHR